MIVDRQLYNSFPTAGDPIPLPTENLEVDDSNYVGDEALLTVTEAKLFLAVGEKLGLPMGHPSIVQEVSQILHEVPDIYPQSEEYRRTVCFLGQTDEESFFHTTQEQVVDIAGRHLSSTQRIEEAMDFSRKVHALGDKPNRRTGEAFAAHPLRSTYFLASMLEATGAHERLPTQELESSYILTLLHDVEEELESDRPDGTHASILDGHLVVIHDGRTLAFSVTPDEEVSLELLKKGAKDKDTYLRKVLRDPSGLAQLTKSMERYDNVQTLYTTSKWRKLLADLFESYTLMPYVEIPAAQKLGLSPYDEGEAYLSMRASSIVAYTQFTRGVLRVADITNNRLREKGIETKLKGDIPRDQRMYDRLSPQRLVDIFQARREEDSSVLLSAVDITQYVREAHAFFSQVHSPEIH